MDADIAELLRPSASGAGTPLDVDDIRRRVRRRRRTRAAVTAAAVVLALPLLMQLLPVRAPDVVFAPGDAVGANGGSGQGAVATGGASIPFVLARADMQFTPARPPADAISRDEAVDAATAHVGPAAGTSGATARYGTVRESGGGSGSPQSVWAVRFTNTRTADVARGTTVVLIDATTAAVVLSLSVSDAGEDEQHVELTAPLGSGSTGSGAAAQRVEIEGRGPTPRAAALDAAKSFGRRGMRVVSVVFIAETDTRVLVSDTTGCWVYSAANSDRDGTWEASGGTTPCNP